MTNASLRDTLEQIKSGVAMINGMHYAHRPEVAESITNRIQELCDALIDESPVPTPENCK